jgi:hypothetical protein
MSSNLGPDMDEGDPEMEAWMDSLPPVDIDKLARDLKQAELDKGLGEVPNLAQEPLGADPATPGAQVPSKPSTGRTEPDPGTSA